MIVRTLRLAAVLLPASLLLHELAYLLAGGGLLGAHGYLEVAIPLAAALAASLALAACVLPALGLEGEAPARHAPFALAAALIGVFVFQELAEAVLLGGGAEGFAASAAVAWVAPPFALVLGALAAALVSWLERAGRLAGPGSGAIAPADPAAGAARARLRPRVPRARLRGAQLRLLTPPAARPLLI